MASKLGPLAVIVGHELRSRLRDGTALLVAFVAPVVLATLFGVALGGDDEAPLRTTIGVVDDDGGDFPASVQREAMETEELREVLEFRQFSDEAVAQDALDAGEIGAAIVFPAGFSDSVSAGEGGQVSVLESVDAPYAGAIARSLVDPEGPALRISGDTVAAAEVDMTVHYGAGMAVMFAFFVAGTSARSLLTERQLGTLDRLRAAPIPLWTALAGKATVGFVLALVSMCVTWASSVAIFGTEWGDPVAVFLLLLGHVFAATMLVLLVASRARTDAQVDGFVMAVSFVFALLGGSIVPVYNLPDFLQTATLITPNGWVRFA